MPLRFDLGPAADRALAPLGRAAPAAEPTHCLGALSARYESGGRGPGAISTGRNDPGGVSYGLFQLASKTGTVGAFLTAEGAPWAAAFGTARPGSAAFSAAWRRVAQAEPEVFAQAQRGFVERTHYRPALAAVLARTGLDLDRRADAVRDACWSCAVQHGAAARILVEAVSEADHRCARSTPDYDRALITAIYVRRTNYVAAVARGASPPERATLLDIVNHRYPAEQAAALAMLDAAGEP